MVLGRDGLRLNVIKAAQKQRSYPSSAVDRLSEGAPQCLEGILASRIRSETNEDREG